MSKWCDVLFETDSFLWSEGRTGSSGTGSCLSTAPWRKATVPGAAVKLRMVHCELTPLSRVSSKFLQESYTHIFSLTPKNLSCNNAWKIPGWVGERRYQWKDIGVCIPELKSLRQGRFWNSKIFTFKHDNTGHKYYRVPQPCLHQHPQSKTTTFQQENMWILIQWNNHKEPLANLGQVLLPSWLWKT